MELGALEHALDHARAYLVVIGQIGNGRQHLVGLPFAGGDAFAQVTLDALTWPLRSPRHTS